MPQPSGTILRLVARDFLKASPRAKPGEVYVVVYNDGSVRVSAGVPSYRVLLRSPFCYIVDTAERRMRNSFSVPTVTDAYSFKVEVDANWKVTSPEAVVRVGLVDGNEAVLGKLQEELWAIGRDYRPQDAVGAEAAALSALSGPRELDEGVTILRAVARFQIDDHLTAAVVETDEASRLGRIERQRFSVLRDMVSGSDESMIRLHLLQHPEDTGAVLQMMTDAEDKNQAVRLGLLARMLEHNLITDADAQPLRDAILSQPISGAPVKMRPITSTSAGNATLPEASESTSEPRHLTVDFPEHKSEGRRISLQVRIVLNQPAQVRSTQLKRFHVPPEGRDVTIAVSALGFAPESDLEQNSYVPYSADSEPVRFGFVTSRPGLHTITIRVFAGGALAGELAAQVPLKSAPPREGSGPG